MARIRARQREQPKASGGRSLATTKKAKVGKRKRLSSAITSKIAARKLEAFLEASPVNKTDFAGKVGVTPRTLLSFRRTFKIKRETLGLIANEMGLTIEELTRKD